MARVFTSGFELNTISGGVEFTGTAGSPTISSTTKRSGGFAGRISSLASGTPKHFRFSIVSINKGYMRFYINIATRPSAENVICLINNTADLLTPVVYISLDNTGVLKLYDEDGQIGSASSVLALNNWYRVEIGIDKTGAGGAHVVEAKLSGVVFATASNRDISALSFGPFFWGGNLLSEAQTAGDWFFDDIAINDSNGTTQNSYPGSGKVVLLTPNADGDSHAWLDTTGSAGTANNYTLVDEIPPNDATDFVQSNTLNAIDMYNYVSANINLVDTVTLITIMVRFRNGTADATTAFRVRVEKTASGTISESSSIIPNTTTWTENSIAAPKTNPLTLYKDPDNAAWTKTTIDSIQAGIKLTAANVNAIQVSAVDIYVEYVPVVSFSIFGDQQFVS